MNCCFEKTPELKPPAIPLGQAIDATNYKCTAISSTQANQIREIFDLFDTDGGGCIDQKELQFAMTALGFQTQEKHRKDKHQEALEVMSNLVDDGKVTLEEFTTLMTGELNGQDPYDEARSAFALLSKPDTNSAHDGFITLNKLEAVCKELQVVQFIVCLCYLPPHPPNSLLRQLFLKYFHWSLLPILERHAMY